MSVILIVVIQQIHICRLQLLSADAWMAVVVDKFLDQFQ